jgi:hypothetical protein
LDLRVGSDRENAPVADRDRRRSRVSTGGDLVHTSTMQDHIGLHEEHDRL